jgi:DNA polymerase type B, organellar and viral
MVPKDSRSAFIDLSSGDLERVEYKGRFLDLSVLAYALRSEHRTLDDWCEHFEIGRKLPHTPTGKITTDEVTYCRNDVRITVALLNALKREYETFPLDIEPERAMSAASIAKAYLDKIGLEPPSTKFKLSDQLLGLSMSAYYGGRAEIRIRHTEVPVVFCDFTSEYPTVQTLLGNWNVLIAHKVEVRQCTVEVQRLLQTITPERVLDKSLWNNLACFALVKPDGDILPVRTCYGDKVSTNIGLNPLYSDKPIWYPVLDLVGSVLLARKVPAVLKAFRLVPVGVQKDLRCTSLGNREIDPEAEDFFRAIIEERKRLPDEDPGQHLLKILANAGAYGIWAELNKESSGRNDLKQFHVYCGGQEFTETTSSFEKPGPWYFPPVAALITGAGRLLLALLERMVTDLGGTYLMTDTDSMAIVSTEKGGLVPCAGGSHKMPDGRAAIRALTWDQVRQITAQFNRLNPYDTSAVKNILKVEKINFDRNGKQHQLYGFAISAKRYDLYLRRPNGTVQIVKPSEHGLGHLYFPDTRKRYIPKDCLNQKDSYPQWIVEAWEYLLRFHAGRTRMLKHGMEEEALDSAPEWSSRMAMMNMRITTPNVLVNLRKLDREMARPFNFFHMPVLRGNPNCTLIAPFNKDSRQWETQDYIDINTGKIVKLGTRYKGSFVLGMSFLSVIKDYYEHNESKSLAPDGSKSGPDTSGLLRRYPVEAITPFHLMGKEVERKASDGPDISMFAEPRRYSPYRGKVVATREIRTELTKIPLRQQMRDTGLSHHTLLLIQRGEAVKRKTLEKVNAYLQSQISRQNK